MGMHIGLIAAKTSVPQLREAFSQTWSQFEIVESADHFANATDVWTWKKSHEQFVSAAEWSKDNPGREVFIFWQDGPWAVMMDLSYTLASDQKALQSLSGKLGTVITFVVESASGCAAFCCFENGDLRRQITNNDGELTTKGNRLPEEAGIAVDRYYMEETDALCRAFGMTSVEKVPGLDGCQAICTVDRTDYGKVVSHGREA